MTSAVRTEIPADSLRGSEWRKSSYSGAVGNCVELAHLDGANVAVRNSRNPHGPALVWSRSGVSELLAAVRTGEVDGAGV
jgi:hypothetical protein